MPELTSIASRIAGKIAQLFRGAWPTLVSTSAFLLVILAMALAWNDFRRSRTPELDQPRSSGILVYRAILDSFDVDTRIVRGDVVALFSTVPRKSVGSTVATYPAPFYCQSDEKLLIDFSKVTIFKGPTDSWLVDLGRMYSEEGLKGIQDIQPLGPCDPTQPNSGFTVAQTNHWWGQYLYLAGSHAALLAVGNPRIFPFDHYLVVYRTWIPLLVQTSNGRIIGVLGLHEVENNIPGFSIRYAAPHEIETWPIPKAAQAGTINYNESMWAGKQNAVVVERPLFLKAVTLFLAAVLTVYLIYFALARQLDKLLPDVLGFFLTVWAIRAAISVGAPKIPTLVDYGALCFYVGFVAVVLLKFARKSAR